MPSQIKTVIKSMAQSNPIERKPHLTSAHTEKNNKLGIFSESRVRKLECCKMLLYKGFPSNFCQVRFRLDRLENKGFLTQSYSVIMLVCLNKQIIVTWDAFGTQKQEHLKHGVKHAKRNLWQHHRKKQKTPDA